ncbi:MAG TPA: MAPEG family protein [Alcanivoracaceae bacterium]|nr:MAPEG family protein [Alcanivoracaceae bacterium]
MTTAYWCALAAIFLPYLFTMFAKLGGGFKLSHNHNPREFLNTLSGRSQRANWAQQNSFEVTPGFLAAVIIAQTLGTMDQNTINMLALTFVLSRLAYGLCYILDVALLRSIVWFIGMATIIALFVGSAA